MKEHVHTTFEDFTEDPGFIEWVQSGFEKHAAYWRGYETAVPEVRKIMQEAIDFVQALDFDREASHGHNSEDLLTRIHKTMDMESITTGEGSALRRRMIRFMIPMAAAASVALLLFMFFGQNNMVRIETLPSVVETISLPDASQVTVNAGSKLLYDKKQYRSRRILTLEGEAFFEVEKGVPFIVKTSLGDVEVLGTSFNVYSRGDHFDVECASGQVRVHHKGSGASVILGAGQSARGHGEEMIQKEVSVSKGDWVNGQFNFEEARLQSVLRELERQFDVVVKTSDEIYSLLYTGFFNNKSLDDALYAVTWPLSLTYEIDGNVVIIKQ